VADVTLLLVAVVGVALFFDFTNGFHDAANAIATGISTRAWHPRVAVLVAAILNFAGAFASFEVAATVATGIVDPEVITLEIVLAGLIGAISWNLATWYLGLPSSSSHALIGGIAGSAIAAHGFDVLFGDGLVQKVLIPSLAAPVLGMAGAASLMIVFLWVVRRRPPGIVNLVFRRLQLVSSSFLAFTHGTNDAQKTMGIIALALVASGHLSADFERPPVWVVVSAAAAIAAGTYAGGWRIIRTLGQRIAKLEPPQGFAAEASTSVILYLTAHLGFPVSTTHTISGSVLGAGATRRFSAVRWGVAGNIVTAWVMTIPCAGLVGAGMQGITRVPGGPAIVFAFGVVVAWLAFTTRSRVTARLEPAASQS
jgi:PiT family inorganic phosphate transporter